MSPSALLQPGSRLVDRYRLEERVAGDGDATLWRATDEVLGRAVGVRVLDRTAPHAEPVLAAARSAAGLADSRFLRVLDANAMDDVVYVVTEWVAGRTLADLVADEPLPAPEAVRIAREVAAALAGAHRQGLHHRRLGPDAVLRTETGQVKVAGLGVDAAALGLPPAGPEAAAASDTRAAGAVLYAGVTGRWPGPEPVASLPPAPVDDDGALCSPRQVRAGVPPEVDEIADRALAEAPRQGRTPLRTPADLATALTATATALRPGAPRAAGRSERTAVHAAPAGVAAPWRAGPAEETAAVPLEPAAGGWGRDDATAYRPLERYDGPEGGDRYADEGPATFRRGRAARTGWVVAVVLLLAGVALVAYQLAVSAFGGDGPTDRRSGGRSGATSPPASAGPVPVRAVDAFDPQSQDGRENDDRVRRAVDGNPATAWTTSSYQQQLGPGGLKTGVGLLLDLGGLREVSALRLQLGGSGTDVEMRVAESRGARAEDYRLVARAVQAGDTATLRPPSPVRAQYVLVWLTSLPRTSDGTYRGSIAEIRVSG